MKVEARGAALAPRPEEGDFLEVPAAERGSCLRLDVRTATCLYSGWVRDLHHGK